MGDLAGITSRLDYVADLGATAVWLSPFYPSPMADFGYDVTDYTDVDPLFGDLSAFDRLRDRAHELGLKVIIDWVPNHTSSAHPWFLESRSSRGNPKRDWYTWRDASPDGGPPNNWLADFGGPAWEWDDRTGQYYLHSFLPEQPDLNWRNQDVVEAMHDTLRFWLDRGVDGFRIDAAHYVMKDPELRDNPPRTRKPGVPTKSRGELDLMEHRHSRGHPDLHEVFAGLRDLADGYEGDRVLIGEIHEYHWPTWSSYYGAQCDELHMLFNFSMLYAPWEASEFRQLVDDLEASLPEGAWPNYVLGNHDEPRMVHRFGAQACRIAAMLLLTLRGTPTIYYGDELGMLEAHIPTDQQRDPWGVRVPGLGRDGCRTPMQWSTRTHAGFSAAEPWLPVVDPDRRHNVAAASADPSSLLNLYRHLLHLRRREPSLTLGDFSPLQAPSGVFAYRRSAPDAAPITVLLNFAVESREVEVDEGTVIARTGPAGPQPVAGRMTVGGSEGVVIRHRDHG